MSYAPPVYECGTRPFLRWVRSQGRSPDASGSPKNASGRVGIPLLGRHRRQAINLTPPRRFKAWGNGSLRPEVYPFMRHIRPNRAAHTTAGRSASQQIEKPLYESGLETNRSCQVFSERNLYRLSLTFMQIRQINLPVICTKF